MKNSILRVRRSRDSQEPEGFPESEANGGYRS